MLPTVRENEKQQQVLRLATLAQDDSICMSWKRIEEVGSD
jgi:hypothetical protein